ncbi:chorismate mutase [Hirschia baltica]|uniref:chorismate mutase n=1 Tax=Hirschia baltica (strain ATCC 49814 / DSM 5838 / IFAM 1418) TaxID=582402 RepID=C6XN30_HIRBI|nr:chorismate mutase [Hirschia baltica]ACT58200.1 Chorismate mutase [Hirschia baltica ATCC 49814]
MSKSTSQSASDGSDTNHITGETYNSDPRKKTGPECESMTDVRYEIDRIDRLLVEILAERTTYIKAASRIKPDREMVRDVPRIEDVVAKVLAHSKEHNLPAEIADPVWRLLIERSIAYEYSSYDALKDSDIDN